MNLAIGRLQSAVELVPDFALAYAALADAYNLSGDYGWRSPTTYSQGQGGGPEALSAQPQTGGGPFGLGLCAGYVRRRQPRAKKEFLLAIELNRNAGRSSLVRLVPHPAWTAGGRGQGDRTSPEAGARPGHHRQQRGQDRLLAARLPHGHREVQTCPGT